MDWKAPTCVFHEIGRLALNQEESAKHMLFTDEAVRPVFIAKDHFAYAEAFGFEQQRKAETAGFERLSLWNQMKAQLSM